MEILSHKIYASEKDLPPTLRRFAVTDGPIKVFRHPLLVQIFPVVCVDPIESTIAAISDRAHQIREQGNLLSYLMLHTRPFRMDVLEDLVSDGAFDGRDDFWEIAARIWMDSEQPEDDLRWSRLLEAPIPGREKMTAPKDRDRICALPQRVKIHRGIQARDEADARRAAKTGWSWTLEPRVAGFFARRMLNKADAPCIAEAEIRRDDIIALLSARGEEEIIVHPDSLQDLRVKILQS